MRNESRKIYLELRAGKTIGEIVGNQKTKARVHKMFMYRKLIDALIDDVESGNYTFSTYELQNLLKRKNNSRQNV